MESKIVILGAGGFGREILCCISDVLKDKNIKLSDAVMFMETEEFAGIHKEINGISVITEAEFDINNHQMIVAIGDSVKRKQIVEKMDQKIKYTTIIHPSAVVSEWVSIGEGSIVTAGCVLTTDIQVGRHAHFNLLTTVGHDCIIGDYFTTAPDVNISGNCTIGNQVYIGTNAALRQGLNICDNVVIGMCGMVLKDISEPGVYVGSPVKKLEK